MCNGHRGTGSRPGLLYAKGVESKGRNEILRGKRDSVGAIAIIRRVDNDGDVIREHFVDIKDNTSISVTAERVPSNDRKRIRGGGREDFFFLDAAWLNEGRCPGGRPSVSKH